MGTVLMIIQVGVDYRGQNTVKSVQNEKQFGNKGALSKKFEKNRELLEDKRKIPNIYKDNFVDLAKLCDSAKKKIH